MSASIRRRLFVAEPLIEGASIELAPAPSRHVQVLRLQPGDVVALFDGEADFEWPAEIVRIERKAVTVRIGKPLAVARELLLRVGLAVGIPANERMDGLVEKATELGVARLQPLVCERSVVRLAGERGEARQRHWQAVAAAASEQCGRVRIPRVVAPMQLDTWLHGFDGAAAATTASPQRWLLSLDEHAAAPLAPAPPPALQPGRIEKPAGALADTDNACLDIVVLSGPEGGLSPAEVSSAERCGFVAVSLGSRVLRADTAPLALLAWLGIVTGSKPP